MPVTSDQACMSDVVVAFPVLATYICMPGLPRVCETLVMGFVMLFIAIAMCLQGDSVKGENLVAYRTCENRRINKMKNPF